MTYVERRTDEDWSRWAAHSASVRKYAERVARERAAEPVKVKH